MIAQEVSISFWDSTGPDIIIHQGEKGREIEFIPDIVLPNGAAAQIVIVKPDKTFTISNCTIDNYEHIIAEIPEQAGAVIGLAHYIIKIMDTDTLVYSASGGIWVDDALLTDAMIESVAEVNGYVFPDDFLTTADLADYVTIDDLVAALAPYALKTDIIDVVANPSGAAAADLSKIKIGSEIYKIPDPLERYSDVEHAVGVWIDGRSIYERTLTINNFVANSWDSRIGSYTGSVDLLNLLPLVDIVFPVNDMSFIVLSDNTVRYPIYMDWQSSAPSNAISVYFPFIERRGTLIMTLRYIKQEV